MRMIRSGARQNRDEGYRFDTRAFLAGSALFLVVLITLIVYAVAPT